MSTRTLKHLAIGCTLALSLSACAPHIIKLDPMDETSRVSVNGEPKGRGLVIHQLPAKYGFPDNFAVKVEPKQGQAYTVEIDREFDPVRAAWSVGITGALGLTFLASDLASGRLSFNSVWFLALTPFEWVSSFYYKDYYDLQHEKQKQQ